MAMRNTEEPFNLYGIRESRNDNYMTITLVRGRDSKEWLNVPVKVRKVEVKNGYGYVKIKLLEKSKEKSYKSKNDDVPF